MLSPDLLAVLRCPKCRGELLLPEPQTALICRRCRLSYAVSDDIPNLLIDEAKEWQGDAATKAPGV